MRLIKATLIWISLLLSLAAQPVDWVKDVKNKPFLPLYKSTTYQVLAADFQQCRTIIVTGGTFTITLVPSGSQPVEGQCLNIFNIGSGTVTVARSGQLVNNLASNPSPLTPSAGYHILSDGTNYSAEQTGVPFVAGNMYFGTPSVNVRVFNGGVGDLHLTSDVNNIAVRHVCAPTRGTLPTADTACEFVVYRSQSESNSDPTMNRMDISGWSTYPFAAFAWQEEVGAGGTLTPLLVMIGAENLRFQTDGTTYFGLGSTSSLRTPVSQILAPGSAGTYDSHKACAVGYGYDSSAHNAGWCWYANITSQAGASTFWFQTRIGGTPYANQFGIQDGGNLLLNAITAPGTPASSFGSIYVDSPSKNLALKDDAGTVKHGVQTLAAVTSKWITSINDAGLPTATQPAESDLSFTDITTSNSSTSKHGFLQKLDGNTAHFLSGAGTWITPAGAGTVTTTDSPADGNLAKFSGPTSITNGDLSGDCSTSGTLSILCTQLNGTNFTVNTSGVPTKVDGITTVGTGVPIILGKSNVLARSISQGTVTLASAPAAGEYEIHYSINLNTPCTTGSNSVSFTFNWTDASNARSLTTGSLTLPAAQTATSYMSGVIPIHVGSGDVTYTSTISGTCSTGTSSYDINAWIARAN